MHVFFAFFGGFFTLLGIALVCYSVEGAPISVLLFIFAAICFSTAYKSYRRKRSDNSRGRKKRFCMDGYHLTGLPFGETPCTITVYDDEIYFTAKNNSSSLSMDKLVSVAVKSKEEFSASSTGTVVAGAVLFGTLGAIIAARPKSKKEVILIINYQSGELKTIAMSFPDSYRFDLQRLESFLAKSVSIQSHTVL